MTIPSSAVTLSAYIATMIYPQVNVKIISESVQIVIAVHFYFNFSLKNILFFTLTLVNLQLFSEKVCLFLLQNSILRKMIF